MATVSIIMPDTMVVQDGLGYDDLDLTSVAANIHAIQWNGSSGHIEYNDSTDNLAIASFADYQSISDAHAAQKTTLEAAVASAEATEASDKATLEATYGHKRSLEYPSVGDQLDALFHAGTFDATMTASIQAIKDKYPK